MSDTETLDMADEDELPGHESQVEPKPGWQPGQVLNPNGGTVVNG